jgi:YVTN family beta-propeller protein
MTQQKRSVSRRLFAVVGIFAALGAGYALRKYPQVGPVPKESGYIVATGQQVKPVGETLSYSGRPVDIATAPNGKTLYLKDDKGVVRVDAATWKVGQELAFPKEGGGSLHGILVSHDGKTVWATGAGSTLWEINVGQDGALTIARGISLPGPKTGGASYPCGIAASPDEKTLYACLSRSNTVAVLDRDSGKVLREISTGIAPYDIELSADGKQAWVSNWGGRRPKEGERTAPSAGTEVPVDERGIANTGTVSLLDIAEGNEVAQVNVGLHASDLVLSPDEKMLYVANANDDSVSLVDTFSRKVRSTLPVKPNDTLPFGSAPNALALAKNGERLYVGCGGSNAVAVVDLSTTKPPVVQGWIPTAWYPGSLSLVDNQLYVACIKGYGSRDLPANETGKRRRVGWMQGTVSRVPLSFSSEQLKTYTQQALKDARVPEALRALEKGKTGKKPVPVPEKTGEPSVFEHIIYVIKENRTYDQMFGDMKQGNGDPNLCLYGREITPNHHALAEEFVLLDNFYCNGVISADGHSWVTEGNVTDHLEKAFGGFTRSYTFGDDPLTYSSSGFLWDNVLAHGLSFRNWGEMDYTGIKPSGKYADVLKDGNEKAGKFTFTHNIGIDRLRNYSAPESIGWNMNIPDVIRADIFLKDLAKYEKDGGLPNLCIVYLPNDHTQGTATGAPTPRSYLADNDLALGQIVEGISKSRFWSKACIFVIEDDPQDGFDHVDGHRSICLVASPYTKRGSVVSDFYNQTSVLHTMEQMLGLPAMNQMDASAPLMRTCFTNKPNLQPYTCRPALVPLAELNKPVSSLPPAAQKWAKKSDDLNFVDVDKADEDTLNRILWHASKGTNAPYPARYAGAHGTGLIKKNLRLSASPDPDDD